MYMKNFTISAHEWQLWSDVQLQHIMMFSYALSLVKEQHKAVKAMRRNNQKVLGMGKMTR